MILRSVGEEDGLTPLVAALYWATSMSCTPAPLPVRSTPRYAPLTCAPLHVSFVVATSFVVSPFGRLKRESICTTNFRVGCPAEFLKGTNSPFCPSFGGFLYPEACPARPRHMTAVSSPSSATSSSAQISGVSVKTYSPTMSCIRCCGITARSTPLGGNQPRAIV